MNAVMQSQIETCDPEALYADLLGRTRDLPNDALLARLLSSHLTGNGALPYRLGLDARAFWLMVGRHFSGFCPTLPETVDTDLDPLRADEREDLYQLLIAHSAGNDPSEAWIARIVAAACMASDHLWQDLGLASRTELSRLMNDNFPELAAANDRDMKWKKFLYKQFCEREGVYTCRAPSCEVCVDYAKCFGPEV
jgi:nitrogen fixation protein NifQ